MSFAFASKPARAYVNGVRYIDAPTPNVRVMIKSRGKRTQQLFCNQLMAIRP